MGGATNILRISAAGPPIKGIAPTTVRICLKRRSFLSSCGGSPMVMVLFSFIFACVVVILSISEQVAIGRVIRMKALAPFFQRSIATWQLVQRRNAGTAQDSLSCLFGFELS